MRPLLAALMLCAATAAQAKPARYPVTEFAGDRYAPQMAQGAAARDVTRSVRERRKTRPRGGKRQRGPKPGSVSPLTFIGRPAGCPVRAWCGCWLAHHLGMPNRSLWLARNWARLGRPSSAQPGAIVVFGRGRGGHVGKITEVAPGKIKVLSGNDGRRVRERWRAVRGVIAYRML